MKITPMDIQRQSFNSRFRGYDADEVRAFLNLVSEEVAELQRDHSRLQQEVQHLNSLLDEHRERETILKNTLLTAQRLSEEIRDNARKQAESTVQEAELRADRLLELAQSRAHEVEGQILDLRSQRSGLRTDVRALVQRVSQILDLQEEAELEDNLRILKRREEAR
jgi:cell division initiation protein